MKKMNRIRELRRSKGLSQRELGNAIGTAQQTISRLEVGNYSPPVDLIINLAEYFDVSIDYLLGFSGYKYSFEYRQELDMHIEKNYEMIKKYEKLGDVNKKTVQIILDRLVETEIETGKRAEDVNDKNCSM